MNTHASPSDNNPSQNTVDTNLGLYHCTNMIWSIGNHNCLTLTVVGLIGKILLAFFYPPMYRVGINTFLWWETIFSSASAKILKITKYLTKNSWSFSIILLYTTAILYLEPFSNRFKRHRFLNKSSHYIPTPRSTGMQTRLLWHIFPAAPLLWWQLVNPFNDLLGEPPLGPSQANKAKQMKHNDPWSLLPHWTAA